MSHRTSHTPFRNPYVKIALPFILAFVGLFIFLGLFNIESRVRAADTVLYVASSDSAADSGDCKTKNTPCATIGYAISQANANDEIRVARGTYTENITIDTTSLYLRGGYTTDDWRNADPDTNETIINGANTGRVIIVQNVVTGTIEGFRIRNGSVTAGGTDEDGSGAGLQIIRSNVIIRNNHIHDNRISITGATGLGAGLFADATSQVIVENNQIYNNSVTLDGIGGGAGISAKTITPIIIRNNDIFSNTVNGASTFGGAIFIFDENAYIVSNHIHHNNGSAGGGAIFNASTAKATIVSNFIYANQAGFGAGIYNFGPIANIWHNTIAENQATTDGGGVYHFTNGATGTVIISNTILISNTASGSPEDVEGANGTTIANFSKIGASTGVTSNNPVNDEPDFLAPEQDDFHLKPTSGMIDNGDPASTVKVDVDGQARPFGGDTAFDVGADESYGSGQCFVQMPNGTILTDLQAAIDLASAGDTVKVAGYCTGSDDEVALISKSLTLSGGYTTTNWIAPSGSPTTLDAENGGSRRVISISSGGAVTVTVEGFHLTGGNIDDNGGGIFVDVTGNVTIQNNVIYNNTVTTGESGASKGGAIALEGTDALIQFNTLYNNDNSAIFIDSATPTIVNNLIIDSNGAAIESNVGLPFANISNNDLFDSGSAPPYAGTLTTRPALPDIYGNIAIDPLFENAAGGNFQLQSGSPVIGQAGLLGMPPAIDIDGDARPQGADSDMGADEATNFHQILFNAPQEAFVSAGERITYTHSITNIGTFSETINLAFTLSTSWDFEIDETGPFSLDTDESQLFTTVITAPPGAQPTDSALVVFTATTVSANSVSAFSSDTTTVAIQPGAEFTPNYSNNYDPGTELTVIHTLTNTGNYTDNYVISLNPEMGSWGRLTITSPYTVEIGMGQPIAIPVIISVPQTALAGLDNRNIFNVIATRSGPGPDLTVVVTDTIGANNIAGSRYVNGLGGSDDGNNCTVSSQPCATIAHGLDLVTIGDSVFVAQGTYPESGLIINNTVSLLGGYMGDFSEGNRSLNPEDTIIDATGQNNRVILINGFSPRIERFTIRGGKIGGPGGGISVSSAAIAPVIEGIIFVGNEGTRGGGLSIDNSSFTLKNNVFYQNTATDRGGAIYLLNSNITLLNNTLVENSSPSDGGGVYIMGGTTRITNTLVASNTATNDGGGVFRATGSVSMDYNNFFGNSAGGSFADSNVAIGSNSLTVGPDIDLADGLRLNAMSPLVDVGDPNTANPLDFEGDIRPVDQGFDIGADELAGCLAQIVRTGEIFGGAQDAIDAAQADDVINIAGHCRGVQPMLLNGTVISQTALIDLDLTLSGGWNNNFTAQNPIEPAILDAEMDGRALVITGATNVIIENLAMVNGNAAGLGGGLAGQDAGGNVYNHSSDTRFYQITVENGQADLGAGFYNVAASPRFTNTDSLVLGSQIISNTSAISGGGFFNEGGAPQFADVVFSHNVATAAGTGGGFYNQAGSPILADNRNEIAYNQASHGAGFFIAGGAPQLDRLQIFSNTATVGGGGIFNQSTAAFTLTNLLIYNNTAINGGGIYNSAGNPDYWHLTLYLNAAGSSGGAFYNDGGNPTIGNTILANNTAATTGGLHVAGGSPVVLHNAYFNSGDDVSGIGLGTGSLTVDPQFFDPVNPSNADFALDPQSLILDAGLAISFLDHDFDNIFRPSNQGFDIGARELGGCKAIINDDTDTIYSNVQDAVDAATSDFDIVRVHGYCQGLHTIQVGPDTFSQTIHLTKNLTLQGGWDETFTLQQETTTLDALGRGHVIFIGAGVKPTIENFDIIGGQNGAIYNTSAISPTVRDNNLYNNIGTTGGAIYNDNGIILIEGGNHIYSNTAQFGAVLYSTGGRPRLQNNFVYSNTTTQNGTLYIDGGTPEIWHNTMVGNSAANGSGVYRNGGVMDIRGNIFINGSGTVLQDVGGADTTNISHNNLFNNGGGNGNMAGSNIIGIDPNLQVEADGDSLTYRIERTSPAFDAGDETLFASIMTDFEGDLRPSHQSLDLGADEIGGCFARLNEDADQIYGSPQYALDLLNSAPNILDIAGVCYGVNNRGGTLQNLYIDKEVELRGGWESATAISFTTRTTATILTPDGEGRGLFITGNNNVIVDRIRVADGDATVTTGDGGGLYNDNTDTFVKNTVFYDNAGANGGAIYNSAAGTLRLWHNTLYNNTAGTNGGGLYVAGGTATVRNNIFNQNTAGTSGAAIFEAGGTVDIDFNNVPAGGYAGPGGVGGNNITSDPDFASQDSSDPDFMKLAETSPVIDVADSNAGTANGVGVQNDFENQPRPSNLGYDMGADEFAICLAQIERTEQIFGHVQEAVINSETGDTIRVHGTCNLFPGQAFVINVITDSLTFSGGWNTDFTAQDGENSPTTLDAQNAGQAIIVQNPFGATVTTFNIINGNATDGGLIYNDGTLTLSSSNLGSSQATRGGAIYNDANGLLTLSQVDTLSTTATADGGVIYNNTGGQLDLQDIFFLGSEATNNGGGIYNLGTISQLTWGGAEGTRSQISLAFATTGNGGAIYNAGTLTEISFSNIDTSSAGNHGGGIYNTGTIDQLVAVVVSSSSAANDGGGIYNDGTLTELRNTFAASNNSTNGAGIYSTEAMQLTNVLLYENVATGDGGGVYLDGGSESRLDHNTVRNNTAGRGGGVYLASGGMVISNSLLISNVISPTGTGGASTIHNAGASTVFVDFTNYFANGAPITVGSVSNGATIYTFDPLFAPGSAFVLETTSPAIDAGDESSIDFDCCFHDPAYPDPERPQNDGWDLGVWEEQVKYEVTLEPNNIETVLPGVVYTYTHTLENSGNISDTFDVTIQDNGLGWVNNIFPSVIALAAGDSQNVFVTVQVPGNALSGIVDTVTILAQSRTVTQSQATATDTTVVGTEYGWLIAPENRGVGLPGQMITYTHSLTNIGNITDTADLSFFAPDGYSAIPNVTILRDGLLVSQNPQTSSDPITVTLGPKGTTQLTITVELADWLAGGTEVLNNVIIESLGDTDVPRFQTAVADTTIISLTSGVRYVSPTGVDDGNGNGTKDNNCTTTGNPGPCRTIAHALSQAMPGDVIALAGNVTFSEIMTHTLPSTEQILQNIYLDQPVTIEGGYASDWLTVDPLGNPTTLQAPANGRGVYVSGSIEATLRGLTITGANPDYADSNGGAIYNDGADLTIASNSLHNNQANAGAAIFNTSTGVITAYNNFIYNNSESSAIYLNNGQATVDNNSFYDNDPTGGADSGANIHLQSGNLVATNNAFQDSNDIEASAINVIGGATSTINTNIYDNYTSPVSGAADANPIVADPGYISPATGNLHITSDSPAVETGLVLTYFSEDIDGNIRPIGATFDIGADEREFTAGMEFIPDHISSTTNINHIFTYTHQITNTGQVTDSFSFAGTSSLGWPLLIEPPNVTLSGVMTGSMRTATITVTIAVAGQSVGGLTDVSLITATSQISPLLSVTVVNTSSVIQSYGVTFTPDQTQTVDTETVTYTHSITNTGNGTDTFSFSAASNPPSWTVQLPTPIELDANEGDTVEIVITIPANSGGMSNTTVITATSLGSPGLSALVTDTTIVSATRGLSLEPDLSNVGQPGETITYNHTLTNLGNVPDSFTITMVSEALTGWQVAYTPTTVSNLPGSGTAAVTVTVQIPLTSTLALSDTRHTLTLTATSVADTGVQDTAVDTTTVGLTPNLLIVALDPAAQTLTAGTQVTYTHLITNLTNFTDTIDFSISNSLAASGWTVEPDPVAAVQLGPNLTSTLTITVNLPMLAAGQTNLTVITATSGYTDTSFGLVQATSINTTTVTQVYSLSLVQSESQQVLPTDLSATFVHTLTNLGNGVDDFSITATTSLPGWTLSPLADVIGLSPGISQTITVTVNIPTNSGGLTNLITVTATSQNDLVVPIASASVTDTVSVPITSGVRLEPDSAQIGLPGQVITYNHTLTNLSNATDSFTLTVLSSPLPGWLVTLEPSTVLNLPGGGSTAVTVTVQIPVTGSLALSDTVHTTLITATSFTSPTTVIDTAINTTTVGAVPGLIFVADNSSTTDQNAITYTHTLTNLGNLTDTFSLDLTSTQGWAQGLVPSPTVQLGPEQAATVTVTLIVPINSGGLTDITTITATSSISNAIFDTVVNATTISQTVGLSFTPDRAASTDQTTVIYTHTLTNLGNGPDQFSFTISNSLPGWSVAPLTPITLTATQSRTVTVTVTIPANSGGLTNTTLITATSGANTAFRAIVTDTTTVILSQGFVFEPNLTLAGVPGQTLTFTHSLTNTGNATDSYTFTAQSAQGWPLTLTPPVSVTLDGGSGTLVVLNVVLPLTGTEAYSGSQDTLLITAASVLSSSLSAVVTDTALVAATPSVLLEPDNSLSTFAGRVISFTHVITNLGNLTDTFTLTAVNSDGWAVTPVGPITLPPDTSTTFVISVTIPAIGSAQVNTTTVTATSNTDNGISDQAIDVATVTPSMAAVSLTPNNATTALSNTILISYQHLVTNLGDSTDVFTFTATSSEGWLVTVNPSSSNPLSTSQSQTITVDIIVPPNSGGLIDTTTVTATSSLNPAVFATAVNTTTVEQIHALDFSLISSSSVVSNSTNIVYTYLITNSGNGPEPITFTVSSDQGWPISNPGLISVLPGSPQTVAFTVTIPLGSGGLTNVTSITATAANSPTIQLGASSSSTIPLARALQFVANETGSGGVGDTLIYTHILTNSGNSADNFSLSLSQNLPWASVNPTSVNLAAGALASIQVSVAIPTNAAAGTTHVVTVTAQSTLSPTVAIGTVTDITSLSRSDYYLPLIFKNAPLVVATPTPTNTPVGPDPTATPTATATPVPSGPDLVVTNISLQPTNPISGQAVTVLVTILNQGTVNVSLGNNFFTDFYVNLTEADPIRAGEIAWSIQGADMVVGVSQTLSGQYIFTDGTYTLHAKVDTQNNVTSETNETNNLFGPIPLTVGSGGNQREPEPGQLPSDFDAVRPTATPLP